MNHEIWQAGEGVAVAHLIIEAIHTLIGQDTTTITITHTMEVTILSATQQLHREADQLVGQL